MAIQGVSLLDMDFSKEFTFEFSVQSHGGTKLNGMYTNDLDSVKLCLASVLWLHQVLVDVEARTCRSRGAYVS